MDQYLIQEAKDGKPKALEMLYKHFYGYAMSISLRYSNSREEACEIVNDSFMKAFDRIQQYSENSSFKAWFRRIVINTSIDYYRKNVKHYAVMEIEKASAETYDPSIVDELSKEEILSALRDLPEIMRLIFNMYEIEGYSHKEIGESLDIPASTCRTYLARAKQRLREKITELNRIKDEGAVR
ncbi:RNA polymerase subunit sigma-70 [Echinicola strongylocentroti]|uniref:RNA polymerase subunit sigma-70 n=1 Tax=Echinicola strongylocentroti TaxID=1795355 RepID=A0A2Z4IID6_9BACT|nr:RNA polymerase sigma factor [Echinicola strongylocentroti]AWW30316.1 RNA polymerase subunit sigma-70 [Echinicola strongylocentroti]